MLELYLLTFNCARNLVNPDTLAPALFDALPPAHVPDILAISLQEISPIAYSFLGGSYLTPYFDRVAATVGLAAKLRSHGREQLQHVATRSLGMTGLMLFAKPQFADRIQWIQSAGVGVGLWNMGNKGAVAMRIGLRSPDTGAVLKMTFAAAHLAPTEHNCETRNRDWETIARNLVFLNNDRDGYSASEEVPLLASALDPPQDNNGLFTPGSHIFFAGDLNYRTNDSAPGPDSHQTYPQPTKSEAAPEHFSHLLEHDQLTRERNANRTLHGLEELPINFPPTYKYSMKEKEASTVPKQHALEREEKWDWSKHRYPSWCDRILFLPSPPSPSRLEPLAYTALPIQSMSDHRPVALSLRVDDRPSGGSDSDTTRSLPRFPLNPAWKARRNTARRMEVVVGISSYLTLHRQGNAILVALAGIAFATWWMAAYFGR
jgi:hypothetical protein